MFEHLLYVPLTMLESHIATFFYLADLAILLVLILPVLWAAQALTVCATNGLLLGQGVVWENIFRRLRSRLKPLLLSSSLVTVSALIGLFTLVFPGMICLALTCLVMPCIVLEERGVKESFLVSATLVRQRWKDVFMLFLFLFFLILLARVMVDYLCDDLLLLGVHESGLLTSRDIVGHMLFIIATVPFLPIIELLPIN